MPQEARHEASGPASSQELEPQPSPAAAAAGEPAASPAMELSELRPLAAPEEHTATHAAVQEERSNPAAAAADVATTGAKSPATPNAPSPVAEESGIGPATDRPTSIAAAITSGPRLIITLLLHSTETRHPYTINEGYLSRRNVNVPDNNPVNMSVYTLKELIWRDWRPGQPFRELQRQWRLTALQNGSHDHRALAQYDLYTWAGS